MIPLAPEKVRTARLAAGHKTIQSARREAGLDYKTVEAYEGRNGQTPPKNPSLNTLLALARAYRCSPRDFTNQPELWDQAMAVLNGPPSSSAPASAPA